MNFKRLFNLLFFLLFVQITSAQKVVDVEWIINPMDENSKNYHDISDSSEGLIAVNKRGDWGYIDKDGSVIIKPQFDEAFPFNNGYARVKKNGKYGFINKKGIIVIDIKYDMAYSFREGLCMVRNNNMFGYINEKGKVVIDIVYERIDPFHEGLARIRQNSKYGFINKRGEVVLSPTYDFLSDFSEGMAVATINNKVQYINKTGKKVIDRIFDNASPFNEGIAIVVNKGKYGLIEKHGNQILDFKYNQIQPFINEYAIVQLGSKFGYINRKGIEIIRPKYDNVTPFDKDIALVTYKKKKYYINPQDEEVLNYVKETKTQYSEGWRIVKEKNKFKYVNSKNERIRYTFDSVRNFNGGIAIVKYRGKWGIIKNPLEEWQEEEKITAEDIKRNSTQTIDDKLQIIWMNPNPDKEEKVYSDSELYTISVKVKGGEAIRKSDFKVYNNNDPVKKTKSGEWSLSGTTFDATIPLVDGRNEIRVKVKKYFSEPIEIHYSSKQPNLHLITVGPSYTTNNSISTLAYTENDAKAVAEVFDNQKDKIFKEVIPKYLLGKKATQNEISKAIEYVSSTNVLYKDVLILYVSAHGVMEKNEAGKEEFRIKANDFDPMAPTSTSISFDFIMQQLEKKKCKKIVLIDACYSGGAKDGNEINAINQAIKKLSQQQNGLIVMTSSSKSEQSHEDKAWRHGAFTKALIDGLGKNSDTNGDRIITVEEIFNFIEKEVPRMVLEIKNERQTPQIFYKELKGDLPIFVY